jgi:hypothetical protein
MGFDCTLDGDFVIFERFRLNVDERIGLTFETWKLFWFLWFFMDEIYLTLGMHKYFGKLSRETRIPFFSTK